MANATTLYIEKYLRALSLEFATSPGNKQILGMLLHTRIAADRPAQIREISESSLSSHTPQCLFFGFWRQFIWTLGHLPVIFFEHEPVFQKSGNLGRFQSA